MLLVLSDCSFLIIKPIQSIRISKNQKCVSWVTVASTSITIYNLIFWLFFLWIMKRNHALWFRILVKQSIVPMTCSEPSWAFKIIQNSLYKILSIKFVSFAFVFYNSQTDLSTSIAISLRVRQHKSSIALVQAGHKVIVSCSPARSSSDCPLFKTPFCSKLLWNPPPPSFLFVLSLMPALCCNSVNAVVGRNRPVSPNIFHCRWK